MMRVSLHGLFHQLGLQNPSYRGTLDEIEQHLIELIRGVHTIQEFADHYCLPTPPKTNAVDHLPRIQQLQDALDKSVALQCHYARILNTADGGKRLQFHNGADWIARLSAIKGEP